VFIVTGYVGCGFELAKILYQRNGTIYLAGRNEEKGLKSIKTIQEKIPESKGHIEFLKVDLADLASIKPAVDSFLSKSDTLHCLTNNAGVMNPPNGSKTVQGYELQMGTNCLGPYLFTKLLLPVLERTAASSPSGSVRVTWAGSLATEVMAPEGGIEFDAQGAPKVLGRSADYSQSKVGNVFLAHELAKRAGEDGIVSVSWNPGNLKTELDRHTPRLEKFVIEKIFLHPARYGAYTELFAGCSPEVTPDKNGSYIIPWGRFSDPRPDVQENLRNEDGGSAKFWKWCDKESSKWA
ncbi:NAD(P)-binding protein, partial [Viridothelium virens]